MAAKTKMTDVDHLGIILSSDIRNIKTSDKLFKTSSLEVQDQKQIVKENTILFESEEQFRVYDACKSILGFEKAIAISQKSKSRGGFKIEEGVNIDLSTPYKKSKRQFLVKYASVTCRKLSVDVHKIKDNLTTSAIKALQEVGVKFSEDGDLGDKKANAMNFMKLFGSHVQTGDLGHGGIFEYVVSYKHEHGSDVSLAKEVLTKCTDLVGNERALYYSASELMKDQYSKYESFTIRVTKLGGLPEAATYDKWILDLSKPNSKKVFIEGGKILPVWNVVQLCNSVKFSSKAGFVDFLRDAWRETIVKMEISPEQKLIEVLGLLPYVDVGITLADARALTTVYQNQNPKESLDTLPWVILETLMRVDCRCTDFQIIENILLANQEMLSDMSTHPMDLFLVIFDCCTPLLQQVLSQKLFLCRRAIPFVIPRYGDILDIKLWPLRSVSLEWANGPDLFEVSMAKHHWNSVSFVRFGKLSISKSDVLNGLLSSAKTEIFCHRDCSNGKAIRQTANGLIELSCFLPKANGGHFDQELLFLNLRGDGMIFKKQISILSLISSMLVIMVEITEVDATFDELLELKKKTENILVVLVGDGVTKENKQNAETKLKQHKVRYMLGFNPFNFSAWPFKDYVTKTWAEMKKALNDDAAQKRSLLEMTSMCSKHVFCSVDEKKIYAIENAKCSVDSILNEIKSTKSTDGKINKTKLLLLQGEILNRWAKKLRKLHRETKGIDAQDSQKKKNEVHKEMYSLRKEQLEMARELQQIIKHFLGVHVDNIKSIEEENIWYKYLKAELDDDTRCTLPMLRQIFKDAIDEKKNRTEVEEAGRQLEESTFGPEHFMRELGQLYECFKACESELTEDERVLYKKLPIIAAKYLLSGHSFEIMDGDAGVVPLGWVKKVFETLNQMVGDKKLFVLSVVGIQSSGKSTLLNTMFGLELTVGAARCTRGVYAQLLPVHKTNSSVDFVLVLDSEGLCGPMSSSNHDRDNEIATFVIGLADFTIININGTNTQQIQDIFAIVVHSFLRMKAVKTYKKQKCIFVHQSVSDVGATPRLLRDRRSLLEELDEMTQVAAETENMAGTITKFNHVIDLSAEDEHKGAFYIQGLWQENPPMAQVSTAYSESVQKVRNTILQEIELSGISITASDMQLRFEDMWNAILADNFLFNFKNNLSVKAYLMMESKFYELKRKVESSLLEMVNLSCKSVINSCETRESIEATLKGQNQRIEEFFDEKFEECRTEFADIFETSNLREELLQWKDVRIKKFDTELSTLKNSIKDELSFYSKCRELQVQILYAEKTLIVEKANASARKFLGKSISNDDLEHEFETLWNEWENGIGFGEQSLPSVETEAKQALLEIFSTLGHEKYIKDELERKWDVSDTNEHLTESMIIPKYREYMANKDWPKEEPDVGKLGKHTDLVPRQETRRNYIERVVKETNIIIERIKGIIAEKTESNMKFHPSFIHDIIQYVMKEIGKHNKLPFEKAMFTLTNDFQAMICVHVAKIATKEFQKLNDDFRKSISIHTFKPTLKNLFVNLIRGQVSEGGIGFFFDRIKEDLIIKLASELCRIVKDEVLATIKHSKAHLLVQVLRQLSNETFKEYMKFLEDVYKYTLRWVEKECRSKLVDGEDGSSPCKTKAENVVNTSLKEIETLLLKCVDTQPSNFSMELFAQNLKNNCQSVFPFTENDFSMLKDVHMENADTLKTVIKTRITRLKSEMLTDVLKTDWSSPGQTPWQTTMDDVWGCKEKCPICLSPCMYRNNKHFEEDGQRHKCLQHWPNALKGIVWKYSRKLAISTCNLYAESDTTFECGVCHYKCRDSGKCDAPVESDEVYHPYKEFNEFLPGHELEPDASNSDVSRYWQWVVHRYQNELVSHYQSAGIDDIPDHWDVGRDSAVESLSVLTGH